MAGMRFANRPHPPTALAMLHGLLAGAAVTLLLFAYFTVGLPPLAAWSLLLFVLAAIGGVVLNLNYHWKNLPLPIGLMVGTRRWPCWASCCWSSRSCADAAGWTSPNERSIIATAPRTCRAAPVAMARTGLAHLPLHHGKAPRYLFERMVPLSREIVIFVVREFGRSRRCAGCRIRTGSRRSAACWASTGIRAASRRRFAVH
jgi:hypothetical protein